MTEQELIDALHAMGIGPENHRLVALLPLVQVAWADGEVQHRERMRILESAHEFGVTAGAQSLLESWLTTRPSEAFFADARTLLVMLVRRHSGVGADLPADTVDQVQALCLRVASAAGGLFDRMFTVSAEERAALATITAHLTLESWAADELLPGSGTYTDL